MPDKLTDLEHVERLFAFLQGKAPFTARSTEDRAMPRKSTTELFWNKVDRSGECWNWTASRLGPTAPGAFWYAGQMQSAPRVAWILEHGVAPPDQVRHLCGNVLCVRPDHLEAPSVLDRLRRSFEMRGPGECWPWAAARHRQGYGVLSVGSSGRWESGHRLAWAYWIAPIPAGMHVLHQCDNPPCVNPAHLFLGTHRDNMADMVAKGRSPYGESSPAAKLTEEQAKGLRREYLEARGSADRVPRGTMKVLAGKYGLCERQAWMIGTGRAWWRV
jgi:HNH endonuclease